MHPSSFSPTHLALPHPLNAAQDDASADEEEDDPNASMTDALGVVAYDREGKPILEEVGEPVTAEEAQYIQELVYLKISKGALGPRIRFAGSQPVSLERGHLDQIRRDDYMVTWKADGVRYILVGTIQGCYLVNRANRVRRIQVTRHLQTS